MNIEHRIKDDEQGAALIIVLGLIALVSLMTVSIITFSQTAYQISKISCDRSKASYWAEGAIARAIWMIHYDKVTHPTRGLGTTDESKNESNVERFLADGSFHTFKNKAGAKVQVKISDAITGIDISGSTPTRYLQRTQESFDDDLDAYEQYKFFLNSLTDYVDSNDFVHLNGGFEKEDYEAEDMAPLPRNYAMQYREEILWVPDFEKFFTYDKYGRISEFRIIAPRGLRQLRGNDNFFSADKNQLKLKTSMDENQLAEVLKARNAWTSKKIPLSENLSPDILTKLQRSFSFNESGYYTLIINASPGENLSGRQLTCTIQITNTISTSNELRFYEWRFLR